MHSSKLLPLGFAAALVLPLSARAAFEGDFVLVDPASPAALYTFESGVALLGAWSVGFFPSEAGTSFIDTAHAPASVTLGAATPMVDDFMESETVLFIDVSEDGHLSFTVEVCNQVEGQAYAGFEIYLSGVALYALTDPGAATLQLGFDVGSGETLEFRSHALSFGATEHGSNLGTVSNFVFTPAAIPEPASFASFAGFAALAIGGRRRRDLATDPS